MIIGSMTGRELFEIFKKDKPMLEKFAIEKAKKLIRELRKGMGRYTTQCYDFKTKDATEYKVCVFVDRGNIRQFYFDMFIYCKETNDYVCATSLLDEENSAEQFSYTPHFLRRYAERALGIENMPINRVLAHIEREVGYTVLIYKNLKFYLYSLAIIKILIFCEIYKLQSLFYSIITLNHACEFSLAKL